MANKINITNSTNKITITDNNPNNVDINTEETKSITVDKLSI